MPEREEKTMKIDIPVTCEKNDLRAASRSSFDAHERPSKKAKSTGKKTSRSDQIKSIKAEVCNLKS